VTEKPEISVLLAASRNGLSIGVQFVASYGNEATVFNLAGQLELTAPGANFGHTGSELSMVCFETLTSVVLSAEVAEDARRSLRSR
jgi:hypothetical protein